MQAKFNNGTSSTSWGGRFVYGMSCTEAEFWSTSVTWFSQIYWLFSRRVGKNHFKSGNAAALDAVACSLYVVFFFFFLILIIWVLWICFILEEEYIFTSWSHPGCHSSGSHHQSTGYIYKVWRTTAIGWICNTPFKSHCCRKRKSNGDAVINYDLVSVDKSPLPPP